MFAPMARSAAIFDLLAILSAAKMLPWNMLDDIVMTSLFGCTDASVPCTWIYEVFMEGGSTEDFINFE